MPATPGQTLRVVGAALSPAGSALPRRQARGDGRLLPPRRQAGCRRGAEATPARELSEELGVSLVDASPLTLVRERAALEHRPMETSVRLCTVDGAAAPRSEVAAVALVGADGASPGTLAPAIRSRVLPFLPPGARSTDSRRSGSELVPARPTPREPVGRRLQCSRRLVGE